MKIQRRDFNKAGASAAAIVLTGCGGGGGGSDAAPGPVASGPVAGAPPAPEPPLVAGTPAPAPAGGPVAVPAPAPAAGPAPAPPPAPLPPSSTVIGVNLVGMEYAEIGHRYGTGTLPNVNYNVPRAADIAWLAANGYARSRLPIKWEMLQPMLHDTRANATARALIGEPGAFHENYAALITSVFDAHAAVGTKCILDLHNYGRYRDFRFQPDGSVIGLTKSAADPLLYAFTTDPDQVIGERIIALAPGATLTQANLNDFWTRAALRWKDHPGFGGYGLMNEPFDLPAPGTLERSFGGTEDPHIWPAYARAAINAIRVVDRVNPIYLGGNEWSAAMSLATKNPDWPMSGTTIDPDPNLIYEVHMYLCAGSSGQRYDFDAEVALGYNAGFGAGQITVNTGLERLALAVNWAKPRGIKLALTETGMPLDDPRWEESFRRLANFARANNVDLFHWSGGNQWSVRNGGINFVPGWHQNKTIEPAASGLMKASAGVDRATLFDDGPGWAPSGTPVTITVYVRGALASPLTVTVASSNGGTLSKNTLVIPAGANGQDQYTFTPPPNTVTTLTYTSSSPAVLPPPPRRVFSLADPVAYAATNLKDAAMAIIAKYSACKWELADGHTDFLQGAPAAPGQKVRAIADSGYGSSVGNAMEMLNWFNDLPAMGIMKQPIMRVTNGLKHSDHSAPDTWGFWCKKTNPLAEVQPNPRNRTPYGVQDPHFTVAAVSASGVNNGIVFQASFSGHLYASELRFTNAQPQARWIDHQANTVLLTSPAPLAPNQPAVLTLTSAPGAQRLRVNSAVVGSASTTFATANPCDQLVIGMGWTEYFPRDRYNGNVYSVITGRGAPSVQELAVLERYLGSTAGV